MSSPSGDGQQDVLVTESDYEEAFDTEKVNEEKLLTQGDVYYFSVNCAALPEAFVPTATPLGPPPHYGSNRIKTAHYTWWNFVPLNLAVQFRHYYNIYFLIAAILSLIPSISPINPLATVLPLLIIILLTFIKDGYADAKRHRVDRIVNDKMFLVCHRGQWCSVRSSQIQVGDLVFLARNEKFPTDCILIRVDREDDLKNEGGCFIETSDLDGESNMKRKEIPPLLRDLLYRKRKLSLPGYTGTQEEEHRLMSDFQALVECEAPNNAIHSFVGLLKIANVRGQVQRSPLASPLLEDLDDYTLKKAQFEHKHGVSSPSTLHESVFREILTIPLDYQHFIPRGSSLKATAFAIGAVVYVGKNTKVFKNVKKRLRDKESTLTAALNRLMLLIFTINFVILALATLFGGLYLVIYDNCTLFILLKAICYRIDMANIVLMFFPQLVIPSRQRSYSS
jgi:magnesium-transporting ATPase (P-type)